MMTIQAFPFSSSKRLKRVVAVCAVFAAALPFGAMASVQAASINSKSLLRAQANDISSATEVVMRRGGAGARPLLAIVGTTLTPAVGRASGMPAGSHA